MFLVTMTMRTFEGNRKQGLMDTNEMYLLQAEMGKRWAPTQCLTRSVSVTSREW